MIYKKKQSMKRSEDTTQKALDEQKCMYQSNWLGTESHAEQLFYLLDWPWGCNHAVVVLTLAAEKGFTFFFLYWEGLPYKNMVKDKTGGRKEQDKS